MVDTVQIHMFYPLLFLTTMVFFVVIMIILIKIKDNRLFINVFNKSNDNAKEVTLDVNDKFSKAHTEVVSIKWDEAHEREMHAINDKVKTIEESLNEINEKLDILIKKVTP